MRLDGPCKRNEVKLTKEKKKKEGIISLKFSFVSVKTFRLLNSIRKTSLYTQVKWGVQVHKNPHMILSSAVD